MADIAVVGRFAGTEALGSVGSTTILVTLFTGLFIGLGGGVNVTAANYIGARRNDDVKETVNTGFLISLIFGFIIFIAAFSLTPALLGLMGTRPELIDGAVLYLRIYLLGSPALAVYNFGNGILSAAGDTKKPLIIMAVAGGINIALNLFTVISLHMGVAGVAIASAVSQYFSAVAVVYVLTRPSSPCRLTVKGAKIDRAKAAQILRMGIPAGLQNAIFATANLFVQAGVNTFSTIVVSGNSAAANADGLVFDVMAAFYTAAASFMGQNYGAKNRDRVIKSYFISLAYSFGAGLILGVSLAVFGRQFLSLFTDDPMVVNAGLERLTVMSFSYCISALMDCTIAASRGLGSAIVPTIIVILGSCVFRIIWIYTVFPIFGTITSIYALYVFSWSITAVAEIIHFTGVYRKAFPKTA